MMSSCKSLKNSKPYRFFGNDWVASVDYMKSTSRYCFSLGLEIFLIVHKWGDLARSIAEVEFIVATTTVRKVTESWDINFCW